MFSGIIDRLGKVTALDTGERPALSVAAPGWLEDVSIGDSIAVNGVCLTVISMGNGEFAADVMPETLRATNLGDLKPGSPANLEKALRVGDRLGGHFVSGHVDCSGTIKTLKEEKNAVVFSIEMDKGLMEFVAPKGSVAVDGISLTVVDVTPNGFTVSLIPHTMSVTTLGSKGPGSTVNIEVDMLARYIRRQS